MRKSARLAVSSLRAKRSSKSCREKREREREREKERKRKREREKKEKEREGKREKKKKEKEKEKGKSAKICLKISALSRWLLLRDFHIFVSFESKKTVHERFCSGFTIFAINNA